MIEGATLAQYAGVVLALLLLEAVLSFDNAAILAAMVRRLPPEDRRKALLYGLVGAYTLRIAAILLAAVLLENQWLKFIGGGYLLFLGIKHFVNLARHKAEEHHEVTFGGNLLTRMGIPMLWATVIQIELVDLAFALDQVLAAVAFVEGYPHPDRIWLIVIASMIGILFLRLAAVFVVRVMDWLPLLEHMAYLAVTYVGVKLILTHPMFHYHIPNVLSITVTLALFAVPVAIKLLFDWPKSKPGSHELPPH
ncbi:MAG: TerC family protein [Thermoplasmatota archaeon]